MTEQEFLRQVWRPYDTVEIDGGLKGRVTNICFPSRSVKVTINKDVHDWFKCDMILSHNSVTGETTDLEIIEKLHFQLMAANKRNEDLQRLKNALEKKIDNLNEQLAGKPNDEELKKLRKACNKSIDAVNSINARMKHIDEYLTKLGVTEEEL